MLYLLSIGNCTLITHWCIAGSVLYISNKCPKLPFIILNDNNTAFFIKVLLKKNTYLIKLVITTENI